ncbi:MAG: Cytochrome oxidase maturation protein, cbb3-type [Lactococcus sp.]|mgnify:CR=1 FL=1
MKKTHHYLLLLNLAITAFCIGLFIFILWTMQMNNKQMISLFIVLSLSLFLGFLWTSYFDLKKELAYLLKIDKLLEKEQG